MRLRSYDYFPSKPNSKYIYNGFKNKFLNFNRFEDFNDDSKIQLRFDNDGNNVVNVYEYDSFGVKLIFSKENAKVRQNYLNSPATLNSYIIKEPLENGNTWILPDGSKRSITDINAQVKTEFNTFKCALEITTISKNNTMSIDYYVDNIGLVKTVYYVPNIGLYSCSLDDIVEDCPLTQKINFYYPDKELNSIWFIEKDICFFTNDITILNFSKEFKNPPNGLLSTISCNTFINYINYDEIKKSITLDFSKDILKYLKSNLPFGKYSLQSIANTLSEYYNTPKIYFTVEDNISLSPFYKDDSPNNFICNYKNLHKWRISDCKLPLTYVVKKDDTLTKIANNFHIAFNKLSKLNDIKNPNFINSNDVLQIYSPGIYEVQPQDTLEDICEKFNLTLEELAKINKVSYLTQLNPGQKLKLC